ncbi:MAG: FMN-binding protein [Ruminococcus sp.]|jgi:electron transport complex protein RnfG|nr:FMN-binding protein [Ruminococcus sp.]
MPDKIKPPLVLTAICTIISALLIIVYNATYVDTTGVITEELSRGLDEIYGPGNYSMLLNDDGSVRTYDGITSVITNEKKQLSFEIITDGYSKNGIHVLVGVSDNGVEGISFIELGETPGLGTKVRDEKDFTRQFIGAADNSYDFDTITGATFSSKGVKEAVDTALTVYNQYKEDFVSE